MSYIIRQPYAPEDNRYYVQQINYLDMGRFTDYKAAKEFKQFLIEQKTSST